MELVSVLRVLARHPIVLAAGMLVALAAGLAAAGVLPGGPPLTQTTYSGFAQAKALVDTSRSYTNDLEGGAEELATQAVLLASLTAGDAHARAIALATGAPREELEMTVGTINDPKVPTRLARSVSDTVTPAAPYRVAVRPDPAVSILTVETAAPTAAEAAALAEAARRRVGAIAAEAAPGPRRGLVVRPLGAVRSITVTDGGLPAGPLAAAAALVVLGLWCSAIVGLAGLRRAWRRLAPLPG